MQLKHGDAHRPAALAGAAREVDGDDVVFADLQLSGQNHEMHRKQLWRDCAWAFEFNDLGMLRLCEVGTDKLDENIHGHFDASEGFQDNHGGQA